MKFLIAVGGTGGHTIPAFQLAKQLMEGGASVHIAGKGIPSQENIPTSDISGSSLKNPFKFLVLTCLGLMQAMGLIFRFKPDVVVGFGSYHSFSVMLGAMLLRKKIVLFEANTVLGKVNRFFAPFATKVATQFPLIQKQKNTALVSFLPWGVKKKDPVSKQEACKFFGLDPNRFTILVFGGSQGAQFLNKTIPEIAKEFPEIQFLHLSGKNQKATYLTPHALVLEFETRMDLAYSAADAVISRSGASTTAELIHYKKPALLIPFPFATEDHQLFNAQFLAGRVSGIRFLKQKNASPEKIKEEIEYICQNHDGLAEAFLNFQIEKREDLSTRLLRRFN